MTSVLAYSSLGFYLASFTLYGWWLYHSKRLLGRLATATLASGLVLHYASLLQRSRAVESVPYQDLYGSMSLFAWFLAITYLGMERFHRQRSVGPLVLPIVILLVCLGTLLAPPVPPPHPPARGTLFALHVTSNILAYAAFALSFVLSFLFLAQNRILRNRKPGTVIWQFPALEVLERMARSSVVVGLTAMLFGSVLGMIWTHRLRGTYLTGDPKEIASLSIFLLYAAYLWLARTTEWRGARSAVFCMMNFLVVVFSYTVVNVYLSQFHRYF